MKYFVIFSLCLVALVSADADADSVKKDMKEAVDKCSEEAGISSSQLDEWKKNKESATDEDKKKMGCLSACVLKKLSLMEGTELKVDTMKEKAEALHMEDAERKEQMVKAIDTCNTNVSGETEECGKAGKFLHCLFQSHKHEHDSHEHAA